MAVEIACIELSLIFVILIYTTLIATARVIIASSCNLGTAHTDGVTILYWVWMASLLS